MSTHENGIHILEDRSSSIISPLILKQLHKFKSDRNNVETARSIFFFIELSTIFFVVLQKKDIEY
jgi:hypothetical protein